MTDTTWNNATADGKASTAGNWSAGIGAGYNLIFDNTSVSNCAMDAAVTYGNITIAATYSGTITQGAVDFGYSDFSRAGGVWSGAGAQWQTCSGNYTGTLGTTINLRMTGTGKTLTITSGVGVIGFRVSGSITLASTLYNSIGGTVIDSGATLNLGAGVNYRHSAHETAVWTNLGTINGPGTVDMLFLDASRTLALGTINAPLLIYNHVATSIDVTLTFNGNASLGAFTVQSNHASKTMTINNAGYSLSATSITAGARGIISSSVAGAKLDIGTGGLTVSANGTVTMTNISLLKSRGPIDTSAGTYTSSAEQVIMYGRGPRALKMAAGQTIYDLVLASDPIALGSNITVTNEYVSVADNATSGAYVITHTGGGSKWYDRRRVHLLVGIGPRPLLHNPGDGILDYLTGVGTIY